MVSANKALHQCKEDLTMYRWWLASCLVKSPESSSANWHSCFDIYFSNYCTVPRSQYPVLSYMIKVRPPQFLSDRQEHHARPKPPSFQLLGSLQ